MKKLVFILMAFAGTMMLNAQTSRPNSDAKIGEFTKLVTSYTSGQRVDKARLASVYNEVNCMLTETQADALAIDLANTREETCGSSEFPSSQSVTDASFKKYAEQVKKYLEYKKKVGDK
ncbi:MAG: hypothetical protein ACK452_13490 [Bacteroidota bacterium]|jgi:hypothetical protein